MQPMMGMPGMQMGMAPQQMAGMSPQMGMAPMAMGTPMGMMQVMPMGMPMMPMQPMQPMQPMMQPMQPMGMNPMMMVPGAQMPAAGMPPMPTQEASGANTLPQLPPAAPSSGSKQRPRRDDADSDEEGRGMQALKNVGSAAASSKEARRGESSAPTTDNNVAEAEEKAPASVSEPVEKKRCHLHAKKPSASCKVCRRIKEAEENEAKESAASEQASKSSAKDSADKEEIHSSRREREEARLTFSCSPMLKDQILKSSYFKSLLEFTQIEGLIEEIDHYADRLSIYNPGSATAPSCFVCQVYRLFTFPNIEDELPVVLFAESAMARCAGFLMIRYVFDPDRLWNALEEHLFDDMEVSYNDGGKQLTMTVGEYVESLLLKEKYFGTPLPRIPVKVRQQLETRLAPLPSFRKRMQANKQIFDTRERVTDVPVEVFVDGEWLRGKTHELVGRSSTFVKVRVKLEDGQEITSHLGKVVLRDSDRDRSASSSSRSDSEGSRNKRKKQRRSRSRSKRRGRSPDWSRWKGKSHTEMLEELRERAKEDAVCGHGKVYPKRPLTFEGFATKYDSDERRIVTDAPQTSYGQSRGNSSTQRQEDDAGDDITRRLRAKQDEERQRQQRAIFEKYGSKSRPGGSDASSAYSDVDRLDRLRLG